MYSESHGIFQDILDLVDAGGTVGEDCDWAWLCQGSLDGCQFSSVDCVEGCIVACQANYDVLFYKLEIPTFTCQQQLSDSGSQLRLNQLKGIERTAR